MRIWSSFKAFIAYFIASVRLGCNIVYKITFSLIFIAFCIRLISAYSTHAGFSVKLLCICMFHSALPHCLSFGALQCQQNTTLANVCLETEFTNTTNNCISVQHRLQHKLSMWMKTKICIGPATVLARKQANINKLAVTCRIKKFIQFIFSIQIKWSATAFLQCFWRSEVFLWTVACIYSFSIQFLYLSISRGMNLKRLLLKRVNQCCVYTKETTWQRTSFKLCLLVQRYNLVPFSWNYEKQQT